ncbi:MAG TPA: ABC transporter substrate-binding protein [Rhizomicrobium sp.]|nr:ABC transporter substrate-binding protein [Rhizomicrobium sp.]
MPKLVSTIHTSIAGAVAVVLCTLVALATPANASTAGEAFVQNNVQRGLQILNNASLSKAQQQEQFRGFLLTLTDLRRIALYTLGPARRTASPADQDAFVEAFRNYAFAVYGAEFTKYSGQTLRVTGSIQRAPGDELVRTVLVDPQARAGQEPIEVDFRVYNSGGKFSVVDIVVAGLDLAITEQEDFSSFLAQHGGDLKALIANLRQRTERVRSTGRV